MSKTGYFAVFLGLMLAFSVASAEMVAGVDFGSIVRIERPSEVVAVVAESEAGAEVSSGGSSRGTSRSTRANVQTAPESEPSLIASGVSLQGLLSSRMHIGVGEQFLPVNTNWFSDPDSAGTNNSGVYFTSEPRAGGIHKLQLEFSAEGPKEWEVENVSIRQATCTSKGYSDYTGEAEVYTNVNGEFMDIVFYPALEGPATYHINVGPEDKDAGNGYGSWDIYVRSLQGDIDDDGDVDATDRSHVVGVWTGADGYSIDTDLTMNGVTNGADREVVVDAWWHTPANCAPTYLDYPAES